MKIASRAAVAAVLLQLVVGQIVAMSFDDLASMATSTDESVESSETYQDGVAIESADRATPMPVVTDKEASFMNIDEVALKETLASVKAMPSAVESSRGEDAGTSPSFEMPATAPETPMPPPTLLTGEQDREDEVLESTPMTEMSTTTEAGIRNDGDDDDSSAAVPSAPPSPTTGAPVASNEADSYDDEEENATPAPPIIIPPAATRVPEPAPVEDSAFDYVERSQAGKQNIYGNRPWEQNANQWQPAGDTEPTVSNGGVNLYPYTEEIRNYIVDQHNFARAHMVPLQAANMRKLRWNEALAIEASELVNTCAFQHDTENYAYGQNLMYGNQVIDKATVESWMEAWVEAEISPGDRAGNGFMDLDHASAVLWAKSYYVGCASKMCPMGYLTACNYFSPGNMMGEQAFVPGPPCSQCPPQAQLCDAQYGKLCTDNPSETIQAPIKPPKTPAPVIPAPTPAKVVVPPPKPAPVPTTPPKTGSTPQVAPGKIGTPASGNSTATKPVPGAQDSPTQVAPQGGMNPTASQNTTGQITPQNATGGAIPQNSTGAATPQNSTISLNTTGQGTPQASKTDPSQKSSQNSTESSSPAIKPVMPAVVTAVCSLLLLIVNV